VCATQIALRDQKADLSFRRDDHALVVIDVKVLVSREIEQARWLMDQHHVEAGLGHQLSQAPAAIVVLGYREREFLRDPRERIRHAEASLEATPLRPAARR
jgi:hypothetical protein